jgi:hypothetical protein
LALRRSITVMAFSPRFLLDRTSEHLIDVFPGALRLRDVGLADRADDTEIFRAAIEKSLTIITENDRHFIEAMRKAASRSGRENCTGDGFGIIVPNHRTDISFGNLGRRLHFRGRHILMEDVRLYNLRVSLGEREHHISPLPRCKFCLARTSGARARQLGLVLP